MQVAAVGCHAFYLLAEPSMDYSPVPVMEVHGTCDTTVDYEEV